MTSPLLGVGLVAVVLGILVMMFSRRQGAKLMGVGAALVLLGWLNPATDLLPLFAVLALVLGVVLVRRATALGLLAILLAVAIGIAWSLGVARPPALDAAPPSDPVDDCRDVAFLGLRGSGEPRDAHLGYGDVVGQMRDQLRTSVTAAGLTFADMPVDYPALAVAGNADWSLLKDLTATAAGQRSLYLEGAVLGAKLLSSKIALIRSVCGDRTRVVVAGYPEGAMASHLALTMLADADARIVVSADLIADPLRSIGEPDALTGAVRPGAGVASVVGIKPSAPAAVAFRSWCLEGDAVCSYTGGGSAATFVLRQMHVHIHGYTDGGIPVEAARRAAAALKGGEARNGG